MNKQTDKSADDSQGRPDAPDPIVFARLMGEVWEKALPLWQRFMKGEAVSPLGQDLTPPQVAPLWTDFMQHLLADPTKLAEMQMQYWQGWWTLWQDTAERFMGAHPDKKGSENNDRRFKSPLWGQSAYFEFIKQSYLYTCHWVEDSIAETKGLDPDIRRKLQFYARQYLDALSPSNFMATNPEVIKETIETGGKNLLQGLENLLEDLERGHGALNVSTTQYDVFELGKNLATTPGAVIYENDLMQLIQYEPATKKAFKQPVLIVPPWINKFYILDLKPENSLIKWLTEQGHTVFTLSWVNPDRTLSTKRFEDYMEEGVLKALSVIETITGQKGCNTIGYCLGGTLLAVTLAWLAEKKQQKRVTSATFLTTLVDFEYAGDMKIFMDEAQLALLDKQMAEKGFLPASHLKKTFSLLRANDMIWTFVVNNYLLGREPFPFDLLYWNEDSTNMPAAMHGFYMRKCYQENRLPEPGGVVMNDVPIDMRKVKTPSFFLSTREDHIAPWQATYATTQLFSGPVHFTLAASGHVAGVINSPVKNKYSYWTGTDTPPQAEAWLGQAQEYQGSWWPHWQEWVENYAGPKISPPAMGGDKYEPIEPAPGRYVKTKAPQ